MGQPQADAGAARADGRAAEEFRTVYIKPGIIPQAQGSAYAEFGGSKLMVAVYGPRETDRKTGFTDSGRLACDIKSLSGQDVGGRASQEERVMRSSMLGALEPAVQLSAFPKAVVDIYVTILEAGGSDLAVAISAASVALASASVPLYDMVSACKVGLLGGELVIDPTAEEEAAMQSTILLTKMAQGNLVTQMLLDGSWSNLQVKTAIDLASAGCSQLDSILRSTVQEELAAKVPATT